MFETVRVADAASEASRLRAAPLTWDTGAEGDRWIAYSAMGSMRHEAGDSYGALAHFSTALSLASVARDPGAERAVLGEIALTHAYRGALGAAEAALRACTALPLPASHHTAAQANETAASLIVALARLDAGAPALIERFRASTAPSFTSVCVDLARIRWCVATNDLECLHERSLRGQQPRSAAARDAEIYGVVLAQVALSDLNRAWATLDTTADGPLSQFATARLALQAGFIDRAETIFCSPALAARLTPALRAERTLLDFWLSAARGRPLRHGARTRLRTVLASPDFRCLVMTLPAEIRHCAEDEVPAPAVRSAPGPSAASDAALATPPLPTLTPTELQVLSALPTHRTTPALARAFGISPNTVKSHLRSIYRKLGCSSRAAAVEVAARYNLLSAFQPLSGQFIAQT